MTTQPVLSQPVLFFGTLEDVDHVLLLSNGTTVGFSNPDSARLYEEILDLENSDLEVIGRFSKNTSGE